MPSAYQTSRDYSRAAFKLGSVRTRSNRFGVTTGPSHSSGAGLTPESAVTKLADAVLTGVRNRDAAARAAQDAQDQRTLTGLHIQKATKDLQPEDYAATQAHEKAVTLGRADAGGGKPAKTMVRSADVRAKHPELPADMPEQVPLDEVDNWLNAYGVKKQPREWRVNGEVVPEGVYSEWKKRKMGLGEPKAPAFDSITESERDAEGQAHDALGHVVDRLKGQWNTGTFNAVTMDAAGNPVKDAKTGEYATTPITTNVTDIMGGELPEQILKHPDYVAAQRGYQATRARGIVGSLARARTFDALDQGLSRFYVGDPLLKDAKVGAQRKAAVLKMIQLAGPDQLDRVYSATEDPSDPLHNDPDVRLAIASKSR